MSLRRRWVALVLSLAFALASRESPAQAPESSGAPPPGSEVEKGAPSRIECVEAHQAAQELKRVGQLLEAQERLSICSAATCPGAIITDCGQWYSDLEQRTPSLVFDVRLDGKPASDAAVFVDGAAVTDAATAFKVNPGRHVVRVELASFEPREENVVLPEGQRMRLVSFEFKSPDAPQIVTTATDASANPYLAPSESRPTPLVIYPLLGVGVVGIGGFGVFSLLGSSKQKSLEESCAPACTKKELKPMKTLYLIGDISGGVGAAALLGAAITYLARPSKEADSSALAVGVGPVAGDFSSLGLSARRAF